MIKIDPAYQDSLNQERKQAPRNSGDGSWTNSRSRRIPVQPPSKNHQSNQNPRATSNTQLANPKAGVSEEIGHCPTNGFEYLLNQVHQTPLLSKNQEHRLALKIFQYRKAFQRLALKEPKVIQHLVQLLKDWTQKKRRLDFVCNVALSEKAIRKKLEPTIRKAIPQLEKILRQLESGCSKTQSRKLHREIVKLVETLLIRPRSFESAPFENPNAKALLAKYSVLCQRMTQFNLGLVFKVSQQVCGRSPLLMDMIQEGTKGLIHAVTKFDHQRKIRFSTYAVPWIRQAIFSSIGNADRLVRIPDSFRSVSKKVHDRFDVVQKNLETTATDSASVIGRIASDLKMNPDDVAKHIQLRRQPGSLDTPADRAACDSPLGNMIISPKPSPFAMAIQNERERITAASLNQSLNQRELDVISLRYGLKDGKDRTFAEVGRIMGITRERVRQIEKPALEKLAGIEVLASLNDQLN